MLSRTVARLGFCALVGAVVMFSVAASVFAQSTSTAQNLPTIVLVHGAWADGSSWQSVILRLQRAGYPVIAVQNPLTSVADDVANTKMVLDAIEGPVIAVGHSFGGVAITGAAADNPNVKALVYIAAFAPEVGEPVGALLGEYPTELATALVPNAAGMVYLDQARFHELFAADLSVSRANVLAVTQKPASAHTLEETVEAAAWKTIPAWYMVATEDKTLNPEMERFLAERMGAVMVEVTSSHVPFLSQPGAVVDLIVEAAEATAK